MLSKFSDFFFQSLHKSVLKDGLLPSKKVYFTCFNEATLKVMKNVFNFVLKVLFFLKIFEFLSWLFGHVGKTSWLEI